MRERVNIREAETSDASKLAKVIQQVEASSEYMLWGAGEREFHAKKQLKMIEDLKNDHNSTILVADNGDELAGYLIVIGGKAKRNQHSAYLVIGILKDFRGQGIGTMLFNELEKWAAIHYVSRLELTVVTKNKGALSLYQKQGFDIEGTKKNSLRIDGEFVDEYYMAKILE